VAKSKTIKAGAVIEAAPALPEKLTGMVWITGITFKGDKLVSAQLAKTLINKNSAKLK